MNRDAAGTFAVALAAIGWGMWALFLRGAPVSAPWISVMILVITGLAWLPFALRGGTARPWVAWGVMAIAGASDGANYYCYFGALARGPIALCVLTHYLAPVLVAALAPLVLREPLGRRTPLAIILALGGLSLLVLGDGGLPGAAVSTAVLGGLSAVFYGINTLATKAVFRWFTQAQVLAFHCLIAAVLVAISAGPPPATLAVFLWKPAAGALLLGAVGGAVYYVGLSRIPAQRAAVLTYLEPLVAAIVGAAFFGERLGPMGLAGGALILAGGVWVAVEKAA